MEKRKYSSVRVSSKVRSVYKLLPYHKTQLIKAFTQNYPDWSMFRTYYLAVKEIPQTLVGYKHTLIAPIGVSKDELEAFIGYIIELLVKHEGDINKVVSVIKSELSNEVGRHLSAV